MSESLLRHLNLSDGLTVSGFRWQQPGNEIHLKPNALASRILCDRHNSSLSVLDSIALRLFEAFSLSKGSKHKVYLFSGLDLERWLLKVLCGLMDARNISTSDGQSKRIPEHWLDILFGRSKFLTLQGLYVSKQIGECFGGPHGISISLIERKNAVNGISLTICGVELVLSMIGYPTRRMNDRPVVYRPMEIHTTTSSHEESIVFSWDSEADLGTLELTDDVTDC